MCLIVYIYFIISNIEMFYLFFLYLVDYNIFQLQEKNIDKLYFSYIILFLNTITICLLLFL